MRRTGFQKRTILNAIISLAYILIAACGGGGGTTAGGGIGGTGVIASGSITARGSIFVNGVEYATTSAGVTLNGTTQVDDSGLLRGMVVRVDGIRDTQTTGTATTVNYENIIKGPVTDVVSTSQVTTLTVLGQTIIVEKGVTYIDDNAGGTTLILPTFTIGDEVEVSGLRETIVGGIAVNNGPIRATYIDIKETLLSTYEVKGVIEDDPTNTYDFKISGLGINFSGTIPAPGTLVEVKFIAPDTLVADSVAPRTTGLGEAEFDHAEVEGFVTALDSPNVGEFILDGQIVNYTVATFKGGISGDLINGTKVEAEGSISGGVLVANRIEFKENIRIEANIDSIGSESITLKGLETISVVVNNALAEYQNTSGIGGGNPLVIGDHVEIRGRAGQVASTVIATELRSDGIVAEPYRVILRGPEENTPVVFDSVRILDTVYDLSDPGIEFSIENDDGSETPSNRTEFFNILLQTGDVVKLRTDSMTSSDPNPVWEKAEIEND